MPRIEITDTNILIDNQNEYLGKPEEVKTIIEFTNPVPAINIYENTKHIYSFKVEVLEKNADLTGQFLHCVIRILPNSGVMIDGIISKDKDNYNDWSSPDYEAIRLQPFFLSDQNEKNLKLKGAGLFSRGLHFVGKITPVGVRNICICDSCRKSFTIQHFHAGFSNAQYFYSSDSSKTLFVPYGSIENLPTQLQENISDEDLKNLEQNLPLPSNGKGTFNYYNNFRCPHCNASYIDFEENKEVRSNEYYGLTYINKQPEYFK